MKNAALVAVILFGTSWARARTLIVNPALSNASDTNPGSESQPLKTINGAAAMVQPGDVVRIYPGVYREAVVIKQPGTPDKPIRFEAVPGAVVVVTGADRITTWQREPGDGKLFSTAWPYPVRHPHPNDDHHLLIGRTEQVFVLGYALRQVSTRDKLTRGTFWVDTDAKRLWVESMEDLDLSTKSAVVETSVRPLLWDSQGAYVQVRGLRFRYAANTAQRGAAIFSGRGDTLEDCVFERTNSIGAQFRAEDIVVKRCDFAENGQMGFSANKAHRLLMSESVVRGNNAKGFSRGWEAGGDKLVLSRGVVIEHSTFSGNRGSGIWFDIGNEDSTVRNCLIENNEDGGIFYEISFGLHAHDNVITGNGLAETPGAWGSQAGINLSSSPNCVIERNLLLGNREGFAFREQIRRTARIDKQRIDKPRIDKQVQEEPVWNHDQIIRNNVLADNVASQLAGWFDIKDQRHWPRVQQLEPGTAPTPAATPKDDMAREYQAKIMEGQPTGLSLEKLHLTLGQNLYARFPGQALVVWGPRFSRHKTYETIAGLQAELSLEKDSLEINFPFADPTVRDYRLPAGHPALQRHCMPEGTIPGVRVGVLQ